MKNFKTKLIYIIGLIVIMIVSKNFIIQTICVATVLLDEFFEKIFFKSKE